MFVREREALAKAPDSGCENALGCFGLLWVGLGVRDLEFGVGWNWVFEFEITC